MTKRESLSPDVVALTSRPLEHDRLEHDRAFRTQRPLRILRSGRTAPGLHVTAHPRRVGSRAAVAPTVLFLDALAGAIAPVRVGASVVQTSS